MPDTQTQPLSITLPPLRITLTEQQQVNLEWLTQNLPSLLAAQTKKRSTRQLKTVGSSQQIIK